MTCRHYRFQIPREEADELRAADSLPCPVCDNLSKRHFQTVDWSPRPMRESNDPLSNRLNDWWHGLFANKPEEFHGRSPKPAAIS